MHPPKRYLKGEMERWRERVHVFKRESEQESTVAGKQHTLTHVHVIERHCFPLPQFSPSVKKKQIRGRGQSKELSSTTSLSWALGFQCLNGGLITYILADDPDNLTLHFFLDNHPPPPSIPPPPTCFHYTGRSPPPTPTPLQLYVYLYFFKMYFWYCRLFISLFSLSEHSQVLRLISRGQRVHQSLSLSVIPPALDRQGTAFFSLPLKCHEF